MSWNGTHPKLTKAEAKAILAPRYCTWCVHWLRVRGYPYEEWTPEMCPSCPRCGRTMYRLMNPRDQGLGRIGVQLDIG